MLYNVRQEEQNQKTSDDVRERVEEEHKSTRQSHVRPLPRPAIPLQLVPSPHPSFIIDLSLPLLLVTTTLIFFIYHVLLPLCHSFYTLSFNSTSVHTILLNYVYCIMYIDQIFLCIMSITFDYSPDTHCSEQIIGYI